MAARTVWVAWQDPTERSWRPVGRLWREDGAYRFGYTVGASESPSFTAFDGLPDLDRVYESRELFATFASCLPPGTSAVDLGCDDPLELLSLIGGRAGGSALELFAHPTNDGGTFHFRFFVRGLRHLDPGSMTRIRALTAGERLLLMLDPQNPVDPLALALRATKPAMLAGYCPSYIARDFRVVVEAAASEATVTVERVDLDAPPQTMLLCELSAPWPRRFVPCSEEPYSLLAQLPSEI